MSRGASRPDAPPSKADQPRTRCTVSGTAADQSAGAVARASAAEVQKRAAWCMIRVRECFYLEAVVRRYLGGLSTFLTAYSPV